jgi:hypothetical protein
MKSEGLVCLKQPTIPSELESFQIRWPLYSMFFEDGILCYPPIYA